jgi:hypothetical protein
MPIDGKSLVKSQDHRARRTNGRWPHFSVAKNHYGDQDGLVYSEGQRFRGVVNLWGKTLHKHDVFPHALSARAARLEPQLSAMQAQWRKN